jgi:hypothetical protein
MSETRKIGDPLACPHFRLAGTEGIARLRTLD